jgi:hypothetical protein
MVLLLTRGLRCVERAGGLLLTWAGLHNCSQYITYPECLDAGYSFMFYYDIESFFRISRKYNLVMKYLIIF